MTPLLCSSRFPKSPPPRSKNPRSANALLSDKLESWCSYQSAVGMFTVSDSEVAGRLKRTDRDNADLPRAAASAACQIYVDEWTWAGCCRACPRPASSQWAARSRAVWPTPPCGVCSLTASSTCCRWGSSTCSQPLYLTARHVLTANGLNKYNATISLLFRLWEKGCTVVVCEATCCMEARPGL